MCQGEPVYRGYVPIGRAPKPRGAGEESGGYSAARAGSAVGWPLSSPCCRAKIEL
jgi:hypothetical protein